jgi:hypothetical protein
MKYEGLTQCRHALGSCPGSPLRQYNHSTQKDSNDGDRSQEVVKSKRAKKEPPNKLLKTKSGNKKDVKNEGTSQ